MKYFLLLGLFLSGCADYKTARNAYREENFELAKENLEPLALVYNHKASKVELAHLYMRTEEANTHGNIVQKLLHDSASHEEGKAYYLLAQTYEEGYGVPVDGARAIEFYQKASDTGYWKAGYNMARLYDRGEIVPQNYSIAETLYENLISEHQYERARNDLLVLRANRAIENKNIPEAEQYLTQLIQQGEDRYNLILANFYKENIKDGSKDADIIHLYTNAAMNDDSGNGWFQLGRIYEEGALVTIVPDGLKAYENYKKSSDLGYSRANYHIGRLYERGTLLEKNLEQAEQYYQVVLAEEEYEPARKALIKVREKLARDEKSS